MLTLPIHFRYYKATISQQSSSSYSPIERLLDETIVCRSALGSQNQFGKGTISDPIWLPTVLHTDEDAPNIPVFKSHVRNKLLDNFNNLNLIFFPFYCIENCESIPRHGCV